MTTFLEPDGSVTILRAHITKVITPFSPDYVSQIAPFRPRKAQAVVMDHGKYNILETIATPDEGKRARLLKASI